MCRLWRDRGQTRPLWASLVALRCVLSIQVNICVLVSLVVEDLTCLLMCCGDAEIGCYSRVSTKFAIFCIEMRLEKWF